MKSKKIIIIISAVLIVATVGTVLTFWNSNKVATVSASSGITAKAEKGDIKVEVTGTGVIEPIETYDISSIVTGRIINSPFKKGDSVKKGDVLYQLDSSDITANVQKTQNSLSKIDLAVRDTKTNLNKTIVYAGRDGRLTNFNVKENDTISTAKLGDIVNDNLIIAKVPFTESQIGRIGIGQSATVYCAALMSSISGTVSKINTYPTINSNGAVMYTVEISIQGITSLTKDTSVTAEIGGMVSSDTGKIDIPETYSVTSALAGRVKKVYVANNDYVTQGQEILELENDTYTTALDKSELDRRELQITLDSLKNQLDNYTIKAPIDGIVLSKNKKIDDILNATSLAQPLMSIADTSKLKFIMKVDELDINSVKLNQTVNIESDAIPGKTYTGKVTLIDTKGTINNGVSIYQVEVIIEEMGDLKPGMNVNAKIQVSQKENILKIPVSAITKKGEKTYIKVPTDTDGKVKEISVETGISNRDYVEILKGLNENDKVLVPSMPAEAPNNKTSNSALDNSQTDKKTN